MDIFIRTAFFYLHQTCLAILLTMLENVMIRQIESNKDIIVDKILRSLPEWFGIESAIVDYIKDTEPMPMLAVELNGLVVGFVSLKIHYPAAAEIYVMGILKEYHRCGLGRHLLKACEDYLYEQNVKYLQVKTLSPARENKEYEMTRKFYQALGFEPLEEFPTLWDESNPCLLMVKKI